MSSNFEKIFETACTARDKSGDDALKLLVSTQEQKNGFSVAQTLTLKKFKSKQNIQFTKFSGKIGMFARYMKQTADTVQNLIGVTGEDIIMELRKSFQEYTPSTSGTKIDEIVKSFILETLTAQVLMDLCKMMHTKIEAASTSERFLTLNDVQTSLSSYSAICSYDDTIQKYALSMQLNSNQALKIMDPLVTLEVAKREFVGLSLSSTEPNVQIKAEVNSTKVGTRCSHCRKTGHVKEKCWTLNPHLKPKKVTSSASRPGGDTTQN